MALMTRKTPNLLVNNKKTELVSKKKELEDLIEVPIERRKKDDVDYINANQVRYKPVSSVNVTGAVIPESMARATHGALQNLRNDVGGNLDEWVANKLQWSLDELGHHLTSEQIDAVALGIRAAENRKGLIIADQTGFGKGRIQAAVARYVALSGRKVIFITEKANLFSDFWRDVSDIGSTDVFSNPMLLNGGAKIIDINDPEMPTLFKTWKKGELDAVIDAGQLPDDTNLVFLSYSQLSRKGRKTEFFEKIAKDAQIAGDEIHNAVGDSTTSEVLNNGVRVSGSTTFSSATFARDVTNLSFYDNVFPWLSDIQGIDSYTPSFRRGLAEESIKIATEKGNIIRREHDLTNMVINVVESNRVTQNAEYADALAPILSRMAKLSSMVEAIIMKKNEENKSYVDSLENPADRKKERKLWSVANFGSRLSALTGQFLIALKVDDCINMAVNALEEGKKPVIVIERTMESLMRELSSDDENDTEIEGDISDIAMQDDNVDTEDRPPTYKEALKLMAGKLLKVNMRQNGEKIIEDWSEPRLVTIQKEIMDMIEDFPELSLSPIDDIKEGINRRSHELVASGKIKKAWTVDEISARNMCVIDGKYAPLPNVDRNIRVANFQNGVTNALVLTRAASTGLSLHDSEKCKDHGVRVMIMLDKIRNILEYVQMLGRVWRRGQITEPEFKDLVTGLPFEWYIQAVNNKKISDLNASVTGSGDATFLKDMEDPMNLLGNDIAYEILSSRKSLSDAMGISMNLSKEQSESSLFYVGKMFRRLGLLSTKTSQDLLNAFYEFYEDRKQTSGHLYENKSMDDNWQPVKRELLIAGDNGDNPIFSDDLFLTTIRSTKKITPVSSTDIYDAMKACKNKNIEVLDYVKKIARMKPAVLEQSKGKKFKTVIEALKSREPNAVKVMDERIHKMSLYIRAMEPGKKIIVPGNEGEMLTGIVVDYDFPDIDHAHLPRRYKIHIAIPGEEGIRTMSLESIIREQRSNIMNLKISLDDTIKYYDKQASIITSVERKILDGNPLAAMLYSHMSHTGSRTVYTDEIGNRNQAILIPKGKEQKIIETPIIISSPHVATALISEGINMKTNMDTPTDGVEIMRCGSNYRVALPQGKRQSKIYETDEMKNACGRFQGDAARRRFAFIPAEKLPDVLEILRNMHCYMYFPHEKRNHINDITVSMCQNNAENNNNENCEHISKPYSIV